MCLAALRNCVYHFYTIDDGKNRFIKITNKINLCLTKRVAESPDIVVSGPKCRSVIKFHSMVKTDNFTKLCRCRTSFIANLSRLVLKIIIKREC